MLKHLFSSKPIFRKYCLLVLTFCLPFGVFAQKEVEKIRTYLKANANTYQLSNSDIEDMGVSSAYLSPTTGWYHAYFVQKYQSIEVYNSILNTVLVKENVANVNSTFEPDIASKAPASITAIRLTPVQAINAAAVSLNMPGNKTTISEVESNRLPNGQIEKGVYTNADLSPDKIKVKLYWLRYDSLNAGNRMQSVRLVWNVQIATKGHENQWSVHIDATSGAVLETRDMIIHCNFGTPEHSQTPHICNEEPKVSPDFAKPLAANTYRVFDLPVESPNHGAQTLVSNPYNKFAPTGTWPGPTNGWHHDGTTSFTNTQGNNVWAKDDIEADDDTTAGYNPVSATLEFDYAYSHSLNSQAVNLNASITNLFYWNNVIHDVLWKYGFDEPSGNFQKFNAARGGAGNDFVLADGQDGKGKNNANFFTPTDGENPRMQMYIWNNAAAYTPDSDFDNGVITHEYGHGWSNRLTGGPANVSCLNNAEQGGEGWSDYLALMLITDWSTLTPNLASANLPRVMATYSLGQATNGAGLRPYKYSYDMTNVNGPVTYSKVASFVAPHGVGSIWATMLWDMTWEIIMQDGQIVSNIYNTTTLVGNVAALKLVNEGLRLQPCSPSFVQARDAILKADELLFNGRYRCSIWKAFARRGLGFYASTGSSQYDQTVTQDFTVGTDRLLSSALTATICTGTPFNYTATTIASGVTTYAWSRAAVTGISNAASNGSTAVVNETLINTTADPVVVTYNFNLTPNGCSVNNIVQPVKVTVNPAPITTVSSYTVCKDGTVPAGEGLVVNNIKSAIFNGTLTSGSPTYQRPYYDANYTVYYPAAGTGYRYQAIQFVSPITGSVAIETIGGTLNNWWCPFDTYLSLYNGSFNAASPATNFLRGDDDSGTLIYSSKVTHSLVAGNTYIIVVTTYAEGTTGGFTIKATQPVFANEIKWFTASSGRSPIATANIFNPVGVSGSGVPNTSTPGTYQFYAGATLNPSCRTPTSFIINSVAPIAGNNSRCGTGTVTLTATGCAGGTINWYAGTTGTTSLATGTSYTTPSISTTTTYSVTCSIGAAAPCVSARTTITATITNPSAPIAGNNSRCGTGTVTLTATGCAGGTINWYAGASGTTSLATGTSYTTPSIASTTTYSVTCSIGAVAPCVSARTTVTATVGNATTPTPTGNSRCGTGTVTLTATGCAGGTIKWYEGASGTTLLASGTTYTTPSIAITTTYSVTCTVGACTSGRASVQATVNVNLVFTGAQVAGSYRASQNISSTSNVATGVNYFAGKSVSLNPGFQAGGSETFQAVIQGCP